MKYNDNGEYKDIYVKAFDTLPVGAEVDYDGSAIPNGWEEVDDLLKVVSYRSSITEAANASGTADFDITLNGYKPIGIVGVVAGNTNVYPIYWNIESDTQARIQLRNTTSTSLTHNVLINVLYVKTTD